MEGRKRRSSTMSKELAATKADVASAPLAYDLDPNGDIVLILNSDTQSGGTDDTAATSDLKTLSGEQDTSHNSHTEPSLLENEDQSLVAGTIPPGFTANGNGGSSNLAAKTSDEGHVANIRIRASSRHLILASRVFERMLQTNFREGHELSIQGYTEMLLPEDDFADFFILLNLIHGRTMKVPRQVDFGTLTELATLVDKYELLEEVAFTTDHWLEGHQSKISNTLNDDLLPWMCISWVFKKPDIFRQVTRVAQLESKGLLSADNLPIPQSVLATIDGLRQDTLRQVFKYLQDTMEKYQGDSRICKHGMQCDAMVLGSLIIGLKTVKLQPLPQPPYNGFSIRWLLDSLNGLHVPQYCTDRPPYPERCNGVREPLWNMVDRLEQNVKGLDMNDVLSSS